MYADISQPQAAYELSGLNQLRRLAKDGNSAEAIKAVAAEFESIFMRMMLKSMRDTSLGDPLFDSNSTLFYRDMMDEQLAVSLSRQGGLGLAEMIERQFTAADAGISVRGNQGGGEGGAIDPSRRRTDTVVVAGDHCHVCDAKEPVADEVKANPDVQKETAPVSQPKNGDAGPVSYAETVRAAINAKPAASVVKPEDLRSPEMFIRKLWPLAENAAQELGVKPQVLLAQAALETGWGKSVIQRADGSSSFNLFNIKADHRWHGDRVAVSTLEYSDGVAKKERAAFRAYASFEESFTDYVDFLRESPRYHGALQQAFNPEAFVRGLQDAGYATDPRYAAKVTRILDSEPMARAMAMLNDSEAKGLAGVDSVGG